MSNIIGSFAFRNDGDGCLTSKFRNNIEPRPLTESSVKRNNDTTTINFEGVYDTVWPQEDGEAILEIEKVEPNNLFNLKWRTNDNIREIRFYGQGMLSEKCLVGAYWNKEVEALTEVFNR